MNSTATRANQHTTLAWKFMLVQADLCHGEEETEGVKAQQKQAIKVETYMAE